MTTRKPKPTESTPADAPRTFSPAPANAGWTVELGGETHRLIPTPGALIALELATGVTIYGHVARGKDGPLPLHDLAAISIALIGAGEPATSPFAMDLAMMSGPMAAGIGSVGVGGHTFSNAPGLVLEAGVGKVTGAVLGPLIAALTGKVDSDGKLKAEAA